MTMDTVATVQLSKFLSFVLRHKPEAIGLALDRQGWASIDELIERANAAGTRLSRADLLLVVETSDKQRFSIAADGCGFAQRKDIRFQLSLACRHRSRRRNSIMALPCDSSNR